MLRQHVQTGGTRMVVGQLFEDGGNALGRALKLNRPLTLLGVLMLLRLVISLMGRIILLVWLMNLVAALLLLFQRLPDPALAWALRLGLLIAALGAFSGVLMLQKTPQQRALQMAGARTTVSGAHSVGVPDDGP